MATRMKAVAVSVFISLVCGALLGLASVKLAGVLGKLGAHRAEPKVAVNA